MSKSKHKCIDHASSSNVALMQVPIDRSSVANQGKVQEESLKKWNLRSCKRKSMPCPKL